MNKVSKPVLLSTHENYQLIAGTDECGRGCLAGPCVAAAVILPQGFYHKDLRDSKKMTEKQKRSVDEYIKTHAIAYKIQEVDAQTIDEINILQASLYAMDLAIKNLTTQPDFVLVDGNQFYKQYRLPYLTVIKGDDTYAQIAAASVLAKVYRDDLMVELDKQYPMYDWKNNKGYTGKPAHRQAIKEIGLSPYHRTTFCKNFV